MDEAEGCRHTAGFGVTALDMPSAGSPGEAYGRMVKVIDDDTIDVQLQDSAHPGKAGCSHGYPT